MPDCFVIMGYGTKTDFRQSKTFDLDKSYRYIIKPAMTEAGFDCVRADEVQHAGVIDVPMYERLLAADVVVADLSTSNVNAFYELGVRHALKPRTTIVIAEEGFFNPFDTNHLAVRRYRHLGEGIDFGEVERMRAELVAASRAIVAAGATDSPVYTFLNGLQPPTLREGQGPSPAAEALEARTRHDLEAVRDPRVAEALSQPMAGLMQAAMAARAEENFGRMRDILAGVRAVQGDNPDRFVVQQLALATYKAGDRDPHARLLEARDVLWVLTPERSTDPETLGLWGAVHKRLSELAAVAEAERRQALEVALRAYGRGFALRDDHYNGINYAFLSDVRAALGTGDEAIADHIQARRTRERVLAITEEVLAAGIEAEDERHAKEQHYWVGASRVEALFGLGQRTAAREALQALVELLKPAGWMIQTTEEQLEKLATLLPEQSS